MFEVAGEADEQSYVLLADAPCDLDDDGADHFPDWDEALSVELLASDPRGEGLAGYELVTSLVAAQAPWCEPANDGDLLDQVAGWDRVISWASAQRARAMAGFATFRPPAPRDPAPDGRGQRGARPLGAGPAATVSEFAPDEIAAALRVSPHGAAGSLGDALSLVENLPATVTAIESGRLSFYAGVTLAHATVNLTPADRAVVEERVLAKAAGRTYVQIRDLTRRAVLRVDPEGAKRRAEERVGYARGTRLRRVGEDLLSLDTTLGVEEGLLAFATLDAFARANQDPDDPDAPIGSGDPSDPLDRANAGRAWSRADVLTDLIAALREQRLPEFLNLPGSNTTNAACTCAGTKAPPPPPVIRIQVVVAASTLMGYDDEPGHVSGIGPISADDARALAANDASLWHAAITAIRPSGVELVELSSRSYRPPSGLRAKIVARDQTCRFPGCTRRVTGTPRGADVDHTIPWPRGQTTESNLGILCRHHHRLKHEGGWRLEQPARGYFVWTSPAGATYRVGPELTIVDTTPPPAPLPQQPRELEYDDPPF